MALNELAALAVRPRRSWRTGIALIASLTAVGCGHSRQSYRPVYSSPAPVSRPCTNCGPGATVTTEEPGTVSSVPSLVDPAPSDLSPAASNGSRPSSGGTLNSSVEKPPTSRLGDEPAFDETQMPSGSQGTPPPPPKAVPPGSKPILEAPKATLMPSGLNGGAGAIDQAAATNSKRIRRTSLSDRLRPYVDDSNADELLYPNKADRPWRYIVLHHSASPSGNYDQIDGEHRKILGFDGCGYHFVIGNGNGSGDGSIEVSQRWTNQKQGVHCRNAREHAMDEYGIGICLVGDLDQQPPTPRQVAAAQALIAHLSQRYNISGSKVDSHAHLAGTPTVCPGKFFPNDAILSAKSDVAKPRTVRSTSWKVVRDTSVR
jgi:N-acetylmuramoyl-L-alanine amidase